MPSQAAKPAEWIAADEARSRLGVRPQTLYAYVSRGRVQVNFAEAGAKWLMVEFARLEAI